MNTWAQGGTQLDYYRPVTGTGRNRPALMKAALGVVQPFITLYMGHSSNNPVAATYQTILGEVVGNVDTLYGLSIKNLHMSVPRFFLAGTNDQSSGTNAFMVYQGRTGARAYVEANPDRNLWYGSLSAVRCRNESLASAVEDPHASWDGPGFGRVGGTAAWALLSASGIIMDVPMEIAAIEKIGTDKMIIRFAPVNA